MNLSGIKREFLVFLIASVILSFTVTFNNTSMFLAAWLSFLIIIASNILTKKGVGYFFETKVKTKFWSVYHWGFRKAEHFKRPLAMAWLPLMLTLITKGTFWWLGILEFDIEAKSERVSKRHGLYRFTQVTEWHMAFIATWGLAVNLVLAVIAYIIGFEFFAKLSVYYAFWSIIPLSSLDGSKIFFSSRGLWLTIATITAIFFGWAILIV